MENNKRRLYDGERRRLIEAVKRNSVIWDKTDPDHIKRKILKLAWDKVAKEINVDVDACKAGWRSIRDSDRYYKKKEEANKSDFVSLEYPSDHSTEEPWEYTEDMHFLVDPSTRLNYSSDMPLAGNMSPGPPSPSYRSNTPSRRTASCANEPIFNVVEKVECKLEKIDNTSYSNPLEPQNMDMLSTAAPGGNSMHSSKTSYTEDYRNNNDVNAMPLKRRTTEQEQDNAAFLNHLDSLLKKLPLRSSESLQAKIMALSYEELAKQREFY